MTGIVRYRVQEAGILKRIEALKSLVLSGFELRLPAGGLYIVLCPSEVEEFYRIDMLLLMIIKITGMKTKVAPQIHLQLLFCSFIRQFLLNPNCLQPSDLPKSKHMICQIRGVIKKGWNRLLCQKYRLQM